LSQRIVTRRCAGPADALSQGVRVNLDLDVGELMPAILDLPDRKGQSPGVVLLHGLGSSKEQMMASIGRSLSNRGVASFAIDLPLQVSPMSGIAALVSRNPITLVEQWCLAVREAHFAVRYLAGHPAIDPTRIGIAGYSLGAYLAVMVAADNPAIRAIVLAAGGDLPPETPFAAVVRAFVDPRRAVGQLAGRPLLMVNGRNDQHVRPDLASALYEAASDPKELLWYDGDHWPPPSVIDSTAEWLMQRLNGRRPRPRVRSRKSRTTAPTRS
jgi:dienelactone hydrolase